MKLSVGVTLIVFTLILSYHLLLQVKTKGLAFFQRFCDFISKKHQTVVNNITDSNNPNEVQIDRTRVPQTFIDLREPLLNQL